MIGVWFLTHQRGDCGKGGKRRRDEGLLNLEVRKAKM
jgi:hypothetical protein